MNTILIMMLKDSVSSTNYEKFFTFVDPFMEQNAFQSLQGTNPKIYACMQNISDSKIREIINKIKGQANYNQVIKSIHYGKLKKI